jgi:nitrile hydratase subunit beta
MNGVHDLGGMHGFGPVEIESDEPVFHHPWEGRVFAMVNAARMAGHWNVDQSRFARERIPPVEYLASTYHQRWLSGLLRNLDEVGLVGPAELAARLGDDASPVTPVPGAVAVTPSDLAEGRRPSPASKVNAAVVPRFRVGDQVVARNINPTGHTRLPRYARGKRGVVVADHGVWVFADSSAMGLGPNPQHVYGVRFEARELWGEPDARAGDAVYVDLWDDHLDPG